MSVLNKLLNLLDDLKEENPEFANKALLAAETLKAGVSEEDLESDDSDWEDESEEDLEETVEEQEEEFDDSLIVVSEEDTAQFVGGRTALEKKLTDYGVYMRDHEVKKMLLLEEIESLRSGNEDLTNTLREKYRLDPSSEYAVVSKQDERGNVVNIVFQKV